MAGTVSRSRIAIASLVISDEFQMRAAGVDEQHASDLTDDLKESPGCLPPVEVFIVGGRNIVTNGFHTIEAHKRNGLTHVMATFRTGSVLEATIAACTANMNQKSLKPTRADKRRAVTLLLDQLERAKMKWKPNQISTRLNVSKTLVSDMIAERTGELPKRKREAEKPTPSTDSDDWRTLPLDEFVDADQHAMHELKLANVTTAGEAHDRMVEGENFGLPKADLLNLKEKIETLKQAAELLPTPPPKPKDEAKPTKKAEEAQVKVVEFEWFAHRRHTTELARGLDKFLANYPLEVELHAKLELHLRNFTRELFAAEQRLNTTGE